MKGKKNRSSSPLRGFLWALSGTFVAVAVGVATVVGLVATDVIKIGGSGNFNTQELIIDQNARRFTSPEFGFEYIVNGVKRSENEQAEYFFSEAELGQLDKVIKDSLAYGPEIYDLRSITFNNIPDSINDVNGFYVPNTHQMFLDTRSTFGQRMNFEQRVNYVLPTIFHEYLHHFANSYLQNDPNASGLNDRSTLDNITKLNNNLSASPRDNFNKRFITQFKNALNYNFQNQNATLATLRASNRQTLATQNRRICFCSAFSAADMYELANGDNLNNLQNLFTAGKISTLSGQDNFTIGGFATNQRAMTLNRALYLYSLTELIPREFTKLGYIPIYHDGYSGNRRYNAFGSSINNESINLDTYFDDLSRSANLINPSIANNTNRNNLLAFEPSSPKLENYVFGGSGVIGSLNSSQSSLEFNVENSTKELYKAYLNAMGYGNEVNQLYAENDATFNQNGFVNQNSARARNNVRISGFLSPEKAKTYKGVVLLDANGTVMRDSQNNIIKEDLSYLNFDGYNNKANNNQERPMQMQNDEEIVPNERVLDSRDNLLKVNEFTFKAKSNVDDLSKTLGPAQVGFPPEDKISYITKGYFDMSNIPSAKLAFWNDLNNDGQIDAQTELVRNIQMAPSSEQGRSITTLRNTSRASRGPFYSVDLNDVAQGMGVIIKRN